MRNAKENPLRRRGFEVGSVQLVEEAAQADRHAPAAVWEPRAIEGTSRVAMDVAGHGDVHDTPAEEGQRATMDVAGNGDAHGESCTGDPRDLRMVLGNRDLGLDDPDADPFQILQEDE